MIEILCFTLGMLKTTTIKIDEDTAYTASKTQIEKLRAAAGIAVSPKSIISVLVLPANLLAINLV